MRGAGRWELEVLGSHFDAGCGNDSVREKGAPAPGAPLPPSTFHLPLVQAARCEPLTTGSGSSGTGPHTYAKNRGVASLRLPLEMMIPIGS
jgi:hypothetical protein